jgi:hypothetical protein
MGTYFIFMYTLFFHGVAPDLKTANAEEDSWNKDCSSEEAVIEALQQLASIESKDHESEPSVVITGGGVHLEVRLEGNTLIREAVSPNVVKI